MADEIREFRVSAMEVEYLKELASRDESLARLLKVEEGAHRRVILQLSCEDVSQLRDCLMTHMDGVGFDEDYSPNEQGRILEALIDRLFLQMASE